MRSWALALLMSLVAARAEAAGLRVGLVGATKPCRAAVRELIDPEIRVAERDQVPGRPSSSDPDALERWIAASVRPGSVDLVLVVDVVDRGNVRVLAFHDSELVGLRMIETGKNCQISGRAASLARAWIHGRLHPGGALAALKSGAHAESRASAAEGRAAEGRAAEGRAAEGRASEPVADARPPRGDGAEPRDPEDTSDNVDPAAARAQAAGGRAGSAAGASPSPSPSPLPAAAAAAPAEAATEAETWTELDSVFEEPAVLAADGAGGAGALPWLRAELRVELVSHAFAWVEPITTDTRELRFDLMPTPRLTVDVRPLDGIGPRWLEPATLRVDFRRTFGLTAHRSEGGPDHALIFSDFQVAVAYPVALEVEGHALVVAPQFGLRDARTVLEPADDGREELELPDISYTGLSPSVAVDAQLRGRVHVRAHAAYQLVLGVGGPVGNVGGSRHGFAFGGGIALELDEGFAVDVGLEWLRYALRFDDSPRARGLDDETLSVAVGVAYRR